MMYMGFKYLTVYGTPQSHHNKKGTTMAKKNTNSTSSKKTTATKTNNKKKSKKTKSSRSSKKGLFESCGSYTDQKIKDGKTFYKKNKKACHIAAGVGIGSFILGLFVASN